MAGDIVSGGVKHTVADFPVQIGVVVVDDPFAFWGEYVILKYEIEGVGKIFRMLNIQPVNIFGNGFVRDDWFVE